MMDILNHESEKSLFTNHYSPIINTRSRSSMDRMWDSGSHDLGSNPGGITDKSKARLVFYEAGFFNTRARKLVFQGLGIKKDQFSL